MPDQGQLLAESPGQDSYSYELAQIFIGAGSEAEMREKLDHALAELHFEVEDPAAAAH